LANLCRSEWEQVVDLDFTAVGNGSTAAIAIAPAVGGSPDSSARMRPRHTRTMDFEIPDDIQDTLDQLDAFIDAEIKPLEQQDDNIRFFDHRREWARTDFDNDGVPRADWEELLREMRRRADAAGWLRLALPSEFGGQDASNLKMAIIREHLAHKGLGLHNDLQNESSIVGNFPTVLMMRDFGTEQQKVDWMPGFLDGTRRLAFGLTEPNHGSDATYMETTAVRDGDEWLISGMKRWNSGLHHATHDIIFARTSGDPGSPKGISAFLVPTDAPGFQVEFFWWTFNMPTDHAEVSLTDVRVGADALFGEADRGLELAQHFVHENRIRQAASSLGAAQYCIDEAVAYANSRTTWGKKLSVNQGIQFPLVELHTEAAMLRQLVRYTASMLDKKHHMEVTHLVAMCNYRANRLACDAADRAMQTCGGVGYSRHMPFEHIYRHHRRYRITEGSEEIQMRKVGQHLFGFGRK
jgi:alkylation response protein AidB-like acyl-CoA dehydrogenase